MEHLTLLRATAQRLSTTPVEDLPRIAGFLATSLSNCAGALQEPLSQSADNAVPLHKLKTRIASLLQDKTSAGRFTAAVVIKSYVEAAPPDSAQWESWTRSLIGCLNKKDPWAAKRVYLSTVARTLLLCQQSSQLQREVSAPLLPPFITATLLVIRPQSKSSGSSSKITTSPLLPSVLHCWNELLQGYGNTLRPFVSRIKPICLSILSGGTQFAHLRDLAAQVLGSLQRCAPKNVALAEWDGTMLSLTNTAHSTLDQVFRGVLEDWSPNYSLDQRQSIRHDFSKAPGIDTVDGAELWPWQGIHLGILRVVDLLRWMQKMLHCVSQPAAVPIGGLSDLLCRTMSVTLPEISKIAQYPLRLNPETGKEEREELWSNLPQLHAECLHLCDTLILSFGQSLLSSFRALGNQIMDLFEAEKWLPEIRLESYKLTMSMLHTSSSVFLQLDRQNFQALCKACCSDVSATLEGEVDHEPVEDNMEQSKPNGILKASQNTNTPGAFVPNIDHWSPLAKQALNLLVVVLDRAPSTVLSSSMRAEMDRLAVLTSCEPAIHASVMNPPAPRPGQRHASSLMPFLARVAAGENLAVEALIRPRMPTVSEPLQKSIPEEEPDTEETYNMEHPWNTKIANGEEMPIEPPKQIPSQAENGLVVSSNQVSAGSSNASVLEGGAMRKRDFAAVQGSETTQVSEASNQPSKRLRNDIRQGFPANGSQLAAIIEADDAEPLLMKGREGITSFETGPVGTAIGTAHEMPEAGTASDDDSDDFEIPPINTQLAEDLLSESEDDDDGEDAE